MTTKVWSKGLVQALINGSASSVVLVIVDPVHFNPMISDNWKLIGKVLLSTLVLFAAMYVKNNPVPALQSDVKE